MCRNVLCLRQTLHRATFIIYLLVAQSILKKRTADWLRRTISHVSRNYISGKWQNLFAASKREKLQRCHRHAPFRTVYFPGQKIRCTCYSRFGARAVLTRGESSAAVARTVPDFTQNIKAHGGTACLQNIALANIRRPLGFRIFSLPPSLSLRYILFPSTSYAERNCILRHNDCAA